MIRSMTGFGRGESTGSGVVATVELKSVNNRYLEISPRMPRDLARFEGKLRDVLRKRLERGKLNVTVSLEREEGAPSGMTLDVVRTAEIKEILNEMRKAAKIKEVVSLSHILSFREELIGRSRDDKGADEEWQIVESALFKAVDSLEAMRTQEGRELSRDMVARIDSISKRISAVEKISNAAVPNERKRLRDRIARLFENDEIDEHRLEMEIVILADKLDVTEEIVRWRSHDKFFREAIKDPDPAGRRLNFLLQEMLREINTIGSKSNDAEIAKLIIESKEELEKIREQVQNIE